MQTLKIKLENCYGIKKLKTELDYSKARAIAVYAPNGAMKTSLAQTFKDLREDSASRDRIFPDRKTVREITDENKKTLANDSIFVVSPYDEEYGHTEKTSTLLVDSKLRREGVRSHVSEEMEAIELGKKSRLGVVFVSSRLTETFIEVSPCQSL